VATETNIDVVTVKFLGNSDIRSNPFTDRGSNVRVSTKVCSALPLIFQDPTVNLDKV
jgi:hypothetical protein